MFKNLILYRLEADALPALEALEERLQRAAFVPCAPSQPVSAGWVPPRGDAHAPLAESVGGQWLLELMVESRMLPSSVVKRRADELARRIEAETGRKPGRKQAKELKEQAQQELLPQAFTKRAHVPVWVDPQRRLLMVDAGSASRADEVVTQLVAAMEGVKVQMLQTQRSPAASMAGWLADGEAPAPFTIDRECELKAEDEQKAAVRYARHRLDIDEVREHIVTGGKRPTRLALTWEGRVAFVLTDAGVIKKVEFLDDVIEGRPARDGEDGGFDADAAIATGELVPLIADLVEALGGELLPGMPAAAPAGMGAAPAGAEPSSTGPAGADDGGSPPWAEAA